MLNHSHRVKAEFPAPYRRYNVVIRYSRRSKNHPKLLQTCHILDGSRSKITQPITY